MSHNIHTDHTHIHSAACGHTRVLHNGHVDYLHNGHLHSIHTDHYDEHVIEVSEANPANCAPTACACNHVDCGHEMVPHGDHMDYLINGRLHYKHSDHCDDHGALDTLA